MQQFAAETPVGVVTHYWSHLGVAGVHLDAPLDVGDHIHVLGHTSNFEQDVRSMEIEHQHIYHADAGADVGIAVMEHVREHDRVYRSIPMGEMGEAESMM
jgi:putative protease